MMTRRQALGAAALLARARMARAKASQPATAVNFRVPPGACDCHTHIFGDPARFPMWAGRTYTPETALPGEMVALHKALHMERVVIVTPSIYGTDNAATLDGMKVRGVSARGVAVIDEQTPESDLEAMDRAGVRGVRLSLTRAGVGDPPAVARQRLQAAAARVRRLKWHVQVLAKPETIAGIKGAVLDLPVPVVFDHFGGALAAAGLDQPGFGDLVELVRSGKAYVKISAAYRASKRADYADAALLAKALIAANADRVIWGSDWPHPDSASMPGRKATDLAPLLQVDDGRVLNLLPTWTGDAAVRRKILVENPARLYGF
jgi:predicted TIM-barrel fold metal-dependent hydrolase